MTKSQELEQPKPENLARALDQELIDGGDNHHIDDYDFGKIGNGVDDDGGDEDEDDDDNGDEEAIILIIAAVKVLLRSLTNLLLSTLLVSS